jgi:glycosyltransferase involved in cell wall biosynthesis
METIAKTKIVACIRQGKVGGGETHVFDLVRKIDKKYFDVEVVAYSDGPLIDALKELNVKTHVIPTEKGFDLFASWKLYKLFKKEGYQLIHAHGTRAASNILLASFLLKIPYIYTIHGWSFHPDQHPFIQRIRQWSEKILTRFSLLNITVSKSNAKDGMNLFGMKRSRIIYNGIDQERFVFSKDNRRNIRQELHFNEDDFVVGYLVRMTQQKDPMTMLKGFHLAHLQNPKLKLLMVGNGDMEKECKSYVEKHKLSSEVVFLDFRKDVPALLSAIDVYCLPSLWEGMPIGLLEAMSIGLPCIATPVDGTKELIEDGSNGLFVQQQNQQDLASKLISIASDRQKRESLARNARAKIATYFDLEKMVADIEIVYIKSAATTISNK